MCGNKKKVSDKKTTFLSTLFNVAYKIASKAITKRIEPILPWLIHPDQTGFVKGRYIGENIKLIADVMEQTKKLNLSGILLSLGFQKANLFSLNVMFFSSK